MLSNFLFSAGIRNSEAVENSATSGNIDLTNINGFVNIYLTNC